MISSAVAVYWQGSDDCSFQERLQLLFPVVWSRLHLSFHDVALNPRWLLRAFLVYLLKDNIIHNNNIPRVSLSSPQTLHNTLQPC